MADLDRQIREYFDEIAPRVEVDYRSARLTTASPIPVPGRKWLSAAAAAVAVLVLVGGVLFVNSGGTDPVSPPTTGPTPTSQPVPTTLAPQPTTTLQSTQKKEGFVPVAGWLETPEGSASSVGISNDPNTEKVTALALGPNDIPYAAWESNEPGNHSAEIYVKALVDGEWIEIDGSATGSGVSGTPDQGSLVPSLVAAPDGKVYVAWEEQAVSGNFRIYVKRLVDGTWEEAGPGAASGEGVSPGATNTWQANLAISPDGTVYLAWANQTAAGADLFVKQLTGNAWVEVGPGSASEGGVSNTGEVVDLDLAVGPDGYPVAIWRDNSHPGGGIYVRKFDGQAWVELGDGSASGSGILHVAATGPNFVQVAVGPDGTVYATWDQILSGGPQIHAVMFAGGEWTAMGEASEPGASSISSPSSDLSVWPSLAVDASGIPVVVWQSRSPDVEGGDFGIFVKAFVDGMWVELGEGSGSGPGLSGGTPAVHATIAFDSNGALYLVYRDGGIGDGGEIAALTRPSGVSTE